MRVAPALAALAFLAGAVTAQTDWVPIRNTDAGVCVATWDGARGRIVVVGASKLASSSFTWEWDGTSWLFRSPSHPPPLFTMPALAYDARRSRVVLHGSVGLDYQGSTETWEWDGNDWSRVAIQSIGRGNHAMVYDEARGQVVMFGGRGINGSPTIALGDTKVWDGVRWTDVSPQVSPAPRYGHAMTFDSGRAKVVLYGGIVIGASSGGATTGNDTWEWDGSRWAYVPTLTDPGPRGYHQLAYDKGRGVCVLFGGDSGIATTWEWNGSAWAQRPTSVQPTTRFRFGMTHDPFRRRTVLLGGNRQILGTSLYDFGMDVWDWDGTAWQITSPVLRPVARMASALAHDSSRGRTVLFGGLVASNFGFALDDTWEWDGLAWREVAITKPPPGRSGHALAFDAARRQVVMFGGSIQIMTTAETWTWDGSA